MLSIISAELAGLPGWKWLSAEMIMLPHLKMGILSFLMSLDVHSKWVQTMSNFTILFTSSGRRVSLIRHFRSVFSKLGIDGKILTADVKYTSPAGFVSDLHIKAPKSDSPEYIPYLLRICEEQKISLVIPLIDTELGLLSRAKDRFQKIGTTVLVSSPETNTICFNKRKTAEFFRNTGFGSPVIYDIESILQEDDSRFPYFIKPAAGSSSMGVHKIRNKHELAFFSKYVDDPILQEFISGEEYTIDVLLDMNGQVQTAVPRLRIETRAGEVSKGRTVRSPLLMDLASKLVSKLPGAIGCITVQCFLTEQNEVKFIEINPRFGGGFPLTIQAGADYPQFLIEQLTGRAATVELNNWKDNLVMLRYDDAIFISGEKIDD